MIYQKCARFIFVILLCMTLHLVAHVFSRGGSANIYIFSSYNITAIVFFIVYYVFAFFLALFAAEETTF